MKTNDLSKKMNILPESDNPLFIQRETGVTHTAFHYEYQFFQYIKAGDVRSVKEFSKHYFEQGFVVGNLSSDSLRNVKYWAVSTIAVAIHYAILGGVDEADAFNLSDVYIRKVDSLKCQEDILEYLFDKATDLTYLVFKSKADIAKSPAIRLCIHYIHMNLYKKISVDDLVAECRLSKDYLSTLFKKEMGINIHDYIMKEKMEHAKIMLSSGMRITEISYRLSFCSETHFIRTFKKIYSITPGEYINDLKIIKD